jgi:hypothetical protein
MSLKCGFVRSQPNTTYPRSPYHLLIMSLNRPQSTSQNLTKSMSSGTIGGMKVVAVKGVEKYEDLWAVRYTRLTASGVKQGAVFLCETQEEARDKYHELLDAVAHHDGVYIGSKAKRKLKIGRRKPAS